jgi:hypothetical protein
MVPGEILGQPFVGAHETPSSFRTSSEVPLPRQKHDLRVIKRRFAAERVERLGFQRRKRKREKSVWVAWCRLRGHPATCTCTYPEV